MNAATTAKMGALFLLGALAGGALVFVANPHSPEPLGIPIRTGTSDTARTLEIETLRREKKALLEEVDALKRTAPSQPQTSTLSESAPQKPDPDFAETFAALAKEGAMGGRNEGYRDLLALAKKLGKGAVDSLIKTLLESKDAGERFLAGRMLEEIGDPAAVAALGEALKKDPDLLVRRMASHAVAVIGSPDGKAALLQAMNGDADWGVRANSAYGLAKLDDPSGLQALVDFYQSTDPTMAPYRLSILGGLADVAAPSTAPIFRELLESDELASQLMAIHAVQKMKDRDSLPLLLNLMQENPSGTVHDAAKQAYNEIEGRDVYP